ncbi:hypothetical protein E2C01_102377 [Portunus trituberculatus]|uniref:Uncharacterized protein n=1 Tax=Portunus trituberculatus TaxID=210409 RepID=A0A5B7KCF5_PORTR|nr:hypothetical protein [Portunus trituberculatus]
MRTGLESSFSDGELVDANKASTIDASTPDEQAQYYCCHTQRKTSDEVTCGWTGVGRRKVEVEDVWWSGTPSRLPSTPWRARGTSLVCCSKYDTGCQPAHGASLRPGCCCSSVKMLHTPRLQCAYFIYITF